MSNVREPFCALMDGLRLTPAEHSCEEQSPDLSILRNAVTSPWSPQVARGTTSESPAYYCPGTKRAPHEPRVIPVCYSAPPVDQGANVEGLKDYNRLF